MKPQFKLFLKLLLAIAVFMIPHTAIAESDPSETESIPEAEFKPAKDIPSESRVSEKQESFMDWCMNREQLSASAQRTMSVILQRAGTFNCARASQNLMSISQLDLSTSQISDISPLQSLTTITRLKLINNQITDLTPLKALTNLIELNLSYNQVEDITPLQSLENLSLLNLSFNQVEDVTPLQSLRRLNELNLNNNQVGDISSLQPLERLTYLLVRNNPIVEAICPVSPKYVCQF